MMRYAPRPLAPGRQPSWVPCHSHAARDWMRQCVLGAAGGLLVTLVAACSSLTCQPVPVTVAQKEERARLDREDQLAEVVAWAITGTIVLAATVVGFYIFFGWK